MQWQVIFQYDTHTAQESGSLSWCHAVMSLQITHVPPLPAEEVAKLAGGLFCSWSLLRNSNIRQWTLQLVSRHFAAFDCWTLTSCQVMQRDNYPLYTALLSDWRVSNSSPLAYLRERSCELDIGAFLNSKDSKNCCVRLAYAIAKAGE